MKKLLTILIAAAMFSVPVVADPPSKAEEVKRHLEFLGYTIEMKETLMYATHDKEMNVSLKRYKGGILFTSYLISTDYAKENTAGFLQEVNKLNLAAAAVRYYLDKDTDLVIEGWYPMTYEKASFGTFLDTYNEFRTQVVKQLDDLRPYLKL